MSSVPSPLPQASTFEWITLDQVSRAPLRAAVTYWSSLRGARQFPARSALNPRKMSSFLPYISLLAVIDGGADFEHRIVGDVVVTTFCVPVQNRRFSAIAKDAPELIETSFALFRKVVETRAPLAFRQQLGNVTYQVAFAEAEMILLPLGQTDDAVDHVAAFAIHSGNIGGWLLPNSLTRS
jgi:hypothetical protein